MNRQALAIILLIPFSILTLYAVVKVGYIGIFDYQRHSPAGWQVFFDLVIACLLILTWLIPEAKKQDRNPWPFVIITVFLGAIGPLLYLAMDSKNSRT